MERVLDKRHLYSGKVQVACSQVPMLRKECSIITCLACAMHLSAGS
jgi:hypothetical protein